MRQHRLVTLLIIFFASNRPQRTRAGTNDTCIRCSTPQDLCNSVANTGHQHRNKKTRRTHDVGKKESRITRIVSESCFSRFETLLRRNATVSLPITFFLHWANVATVGQTPPRVDKIYINYDILKVSPIMTNIARMFHE